MKRILPLLLAAAALVSCGQVTVSADRTEEWKALEGPLNFYLANDLGRNGYYDQKPIAETMGKMAETIDIEFVVAAGDIHHFEGVQSISDPLWMTNYELIYSHPDLMIQWYPICGNHEYRSNTDAVVEYSNVSARWEMPAKYYTFVKEEDGVTVRIVMVDTTPMIDKYREETDKYADASKSDWKEQTAWLDQVLSEADEDWVLVVGHHPIYAYTDKSESERTDLQQRLDPVIRKYGNVDMYLCGHIHTFQHIRKDGCDIDYVVNTSGSLSREDVQPTDGTVFCSNKSGWSLITADEHELKLHMLDKEGNVLHTVTRTR
ncbi:MAG: metallophosphoesterase [Bacteroidetes bacterium]|uniref:acid phosphatase n=1 Tax=Candidatus Cryptobacteroides gallistercoris TaxID=2840765 RepID=A0A940DQ16_9BACT|nr:metallophosphoesterase [Candidatus Cryptobacteroides gallistercoris]